ncbi:MAG: small basic protein [Candidatus Omnitrophica bacterium]|nr:small basic protein [Candidatus Omnitrophota bacterium]
MSIHPSLKLQAEKSKEKTVLKRSERIKILMEKGKWNRNSSIYGLPKIKIVKIKIKKEKTTEAPTTGAKTEPSSQINPTK